MLIEDYVVKEMDTEGMESDPLAMEIIDRMNLANQLTSSGRISFNTLTKDQQFVINNLFPSYTTVVDYKECIPLRILELYERYHDDYEHWIIRHVPPAEVIDPILIAYNGSEWTGKGSINSTEVYLVARWGDALEAWSSLYDKAKVVWRQRMRTKLQIILSKVQTDIKLIEDGHQPERIEVADYYPLFG